ncbi:sterol desaturase family protein [Brevibacillus dissolubilis]|uniref:sterol desaturase family protein n=1 Tax=Brevibacillus dissolubilis TaxID=1844116 RepID=UPI00111690AA|nr:sterol desaturase family protein [Brevibacillus dissolubilis]
MRVYLKEFFSFLDIMVMSLLLLACLFFTLPDLDRGVVWLSLLLGMVLYALSEYLIHRFLFHLKPPKNPLFLHFLKRLHYDHHVKPDELELLFLPVWYSLPQMVVTFAVYYWLTADAAMTSAFATGMIGFLLFYEWTHYVAHRPIQPFTPWGRWMKKLHLLHHFKNENYWYGVTNPAFDVLMGTFPNEKQVEKSKTARDLEQAQ